MRKWIIGLCALFLLLAGCSPAEKSLNTSPPLVEESLMLDSVEQVKRLMSMRDLDEIFALEDDTDFAIALHSALCDWTDYGESLDVLSPEAQRFYLCYSLDAEVNNGGFSSFIYNSTGQWGPETIEALETVGAPQTAELLRQVIALLVCDEYPRDVIERNEILDLSSDAFDRSIDELDNAFFASPDGVLTDLYVTYARDHRDCFSAPEK